MIKKTSMTLGLVGAVALMLTACAGGNTGNGDENGNGDAEKLSIGFVYGIANVPFSNSIQCGAQLAAKEFGAELNFQAPANWSVNEQKPILDAVIATNPDALVIAPTDPVALLPDLQGLLDKEVPVLTADGGLGEDSIALQAVSSNHYEGGVKGAQALLELTQNPTGKYFVVGYVQGDLNTQARADGFVDEMEKHGATILPIQYPGNDQTKAAEVVSAALLADPDMAGVYSTNAEGAKGASNAISAAGRTGEIPLVSFDASPSQVEDLQNGAADVLLAQQPFQMGYFATKTALQLASGELKWNEVEKDLETSFTVITRENLNDPAVKDAIYVADLNQCPTTPPTR